ncbi:hypothetical protein [Emticicia sp. C21]|uniref:hypothetical protein n=1 Tax=Emticicia sp. C21 TaxID=2302915 RepID=UPI000E34B10B|nr:hypothetical protein [Emticicia sp. C21]
MEKKKIRTEALVTMTNNYCMPGAIYAPLTRFFEVSSTTIVKWIEKYSDFQESIKTQANKREQKKVTNMVGTFLNDNSDKLQVPSTKTEPKKVANVVGTFLEDNSDSFQV